MNGHTWRRWAAHDWEEARRLEVRRRRGGSGCGGRGGWRVGTRGYRCSKHRLRGAIKYRIRQQWSLLEFLRHQRRKRLAVPANSTTRMNREVAWSKDTPGARVALEALGQYG